MFFNSMNLDLINGGRHFGSRFQGLCDSNLSHPGFCVPALWVNGCFHDRLLRKTECRISANCLFFFFSLDGPCCPGNLHV